MKLIAFDFGHTIADERVTLDVEPVVLMPGVRAAVSDLRLPMAIWANTRTARELEIRRWLERAGLGGAFDTVVTSVDAGVRKPAPDFFAYALERCGAAADEVLFVGNQRNTDIAGGEAFGIRTVWLSGSAYRSADDQSCGARPTYTIDTLDELPGLVRRLQRQRHEQGQHP